MPKSPFKNRQPVPSVGTHSEKQRTFGLSQSCDGQRQFTEAVFRPAGRITPEVTYVMGRGIFKVVDKGGATIMQFVRRYNNYKTNKSWPWIAGALLLFAIGMLVALLLIKFVSA
jgi:hypothetical protein